MLCLKEYFSSVILNGLTSWVQLRYADSFDFSPLIVNRLFLKEPSEEKKLCFTFLLLRSRELYCSLNKITPWTLWRKLKLVPVQPLPNFELSVSPWARRTSRLLMEGFRQMFCLPLGNFWGNKISVAMFPPLWSQLGLAAAVSLLLHGATRLPLPHYSICQEEEEE